MEVADDASFAVVDEIAKVVKEANPHSVLALTMGSHDECVHIEGPRI